ncbi:hypothetical protein CFL01nite_05800 [Corynebacterium flavescens]|uniref:Uncharacterized protein n=1 Tax=Corynebacterium flavescens TaxID=28028 RepID=A0AB73B568_CORFL|nr:hypothetical protein CFL01nite_05800 [Corynebacterium flavescens]
MLFYLTCQRDTPRTGGSISDICQHQGATRTLWPMDYTRCELVYPQFLEEDTPPWTSPKQQHSVWVKAHAQ